MRTSLLALFFAVGCNSFTTVPDACLVDGSPNIEAIADVDDAAAFNRHNCYRRVTTRPKTRVDSMAQAAVEGHADWMELNVPVLNLRFQSASTEQFTGQTPSQRLINEGFDFPSNSGLIDLMLVTDGNPQLSGDQLLDFWFADPFVRGSFLQSLTLGAGVSHTSYTGTDITGEPIELGIQYWNIIYEIPAQTFAETPVTYPRNGQTDVPPQYLHLSTNPALIAGQTYGFPITVTVGTREVGLEAIQATITDVGTEATIPFQVIEGDEGTAFVGISNTLILVPDEPLNSGNEYQVDVKIKTDQGERRVKSTFTTSTDTRPIPANLQRVGADGLPAVRYSAEIIPGLGLDSL